MTTVTTFHEAQETNPDPDLLLLEFYEDGGAVVDRAVINNEDIIFYGETYVATDFSVNIPSDGEDFSAPSLSISNVDRSPGKLVLRANDRIVVRMIEVDGTDYTVSGGVRTYYTIKNDTKNMMVITDATADIRTISGSLGPKLSLDQPYPVPKTNAKAFPGLYL